MPSPTLHLDIVREAELEATPFQTSYTRFGFLDDMDLTDTPDPDALLKVADHLPPWRSPLSVRFSQMLLQRIRIRPEPAKVKRVNIWLTYETSTLDFNPTAYILRDRTFVMDYEGVFMPGTRVPVVVGFDTSGLTFTNVDGTAFTTEESDALKLNPQPLVFRSTWPARSIQLTTLQYGRPNGGTADYQNYVNDDSWPAVGEITLFNGNFNTLGGNAGALTTPVKTATSRGKGFWRLNSYSTEYDRNRGMTLTSAEALTKGLEDWSQVAMLRDERTGKYPFAAMDEATQTSIRNAMSTPSYAQGILYPLAPTKQRGIIRFGEFPTTNFQALFGF